MTGLFKTIKRGGRTFYRVKNNTVCYVAQNGENWLFLVGSPGAYSNLCVKCETEREAQEKALKCVNDYIELKAQLLSAYQTKTAIKTF